MAYFTHYDLRIINSTNSTQGIRLFFDVGDRLRMITNENWNVISLPYGTQFLSLHGMWYDWGSHMVELSLYFPDITFFLSGSGQTHEDQWRAYFKNGKRIILKPILYWPEFKEEDLK